MATTPKPPVLFTPVAVRPRHDGWTAERQIAFIEKLADCGSVSAAAAFVGMSRESARQLRLRPSGRAFRDAWDAALDCSYGALEEAALERARKGVARPIFFHGEQVGEWRHFDERLTMFLLRFRRRHRFGSEADNLPAPPRGIPGFDPEERWRFDPEDQLEAASTGSNSRPRYRPKTRRAASRKRVAASDEAVARARTRAAANFANFHLEPPSTREALRSKGELVSKRW